MVRLQGTLHKLGTRTARYFFKDQARHKDRLIPWWPFVTCETYEKKHYYVLRKANGKILKTVRIPIIDYIWSEVEEVQYEEYLLTFTEVIEVISDKQYDNFTEHDPDQYIGKDVVVYADRVEHRHFKLFPEYYPHEIEEVE